jgi:hypothetical protein
MYPPGPVNAIDDKQVRPRKSGPNKGDQQDRLTNEADFTSEYSSGPKLVNSSLEGRMQSCSLYLKVKYS